MDETKLNKLKAIVELAMDGYVSTEEFSKLLAAITAAIDSIRKSTLDQNNSVLSTLENKLSQLETGFKSRLGATNADLGNKASKDETVKLNKSLKDLSSYIQNVESSIPPKVTEITGDEIIDKVSVIKRQWLPIEVIQGSDKLATKGQLENAIVEIGGKLTILEKRNSKGYGALGGGSEGTGSLFLSRLRDVNIKDLTKDADGKYVLSSSTGGGGSSTWGSITGTLSNQTDLQSALNAKYDASNFVAGTNYLTPTGSAAGLTSFPTLNQNTTGSAAKLTTARTIAGVSFDGTANISLNNNAITNGAGYTTNTGTVTSVSGTTNRITSTGGATPAIDISASYVGQTSLTTLGTIATGTWNATAIGATYGGTGQTVYAVGDLLYASTTTALSKLADIATGNALISGGVSTAPSWGKVGLTTHISGTLAVGNGGTGLTSLTANYIPYGNGTLAFQSSANLTFDGTYAYIGGLRISGLDTSNSIYTAQTTFGILTGASGFLRFTGTDVTGKAALILGGSNVSIQDGNLSVGDFNYYGSNQRLRIAGTIDVAASTFGLYMGQLTQKPGNGNQATYQYFGGGTIDTGTTDVVANVYGAYNEVFGKSGTGTITNTYGLYINRSTVGTNNYTALLGTVVGIGIAPSLSANLNLAGSTTAISSLRITAGFAPTAPVDGDMWQDGTHLYAYIGGASRQLDQQSGGTGANALGTYIVQTATNAPTNAQILASLGTGIVKNTTTTGVLSIAIAADFPTLNQNTTGSAATLTTTRTLWGQNFNGSANVTGDITLGASNITMTGSLAATGSRVTKVWTAALESTAMPTVGGVAILTSLTAPQFTTIELGAATDTTIARVSAGVISVEGVTVDTISATNTLTNKRITKRIGTEASSATSTPTAATVDQWNVTALAVADAFAAPTGTPTDGQDLVIRIKDNGTARALTWNAIYRASSDLALPSTTVISKTLYLGFRYNAADSKWDLLALLNNF